jgi:rhamnosyl/mannosyltransferase
MRVLHIGKFFAPFAGGIENFMRDLVGAFAGDEIVQAAIVHEAPGQPAGDAVVERSEGLEELIRVPVLGQVAYAPIAPGFRARMEALLARFEPNLPNTSAFWLLASRRARRIPWVVHWHSDVVGPGLDTRLKLLYPGYRPFEQALLGRAAAIIATSPPYLESSRALAPWRAKCRVVPLGLDPARVASGSGPDPDWGGEGRLRVLALGRLTRYKGMEVLARAAREVPSSEVRIVGDGAERRRLDAAIPEADRARIKVLGALDDAARNRLLATCDVLCLPSLNRAEAFGMALLEAMACGKPTIATRVPGSGMDWVVEEGRTGWMVDPGDRRALARLLQRLVSERSRLAEYGAEARRRFDQRFRIEAVADRVEAVYRETARGGELRR